MTAAGERNDLRYGGAGLDELVADVLIIGSGVGGATVAYALKDSGAQVCVVERGDFVPRERENWSVDAVFIGRRYRTTERWRDGRGCWFVPRTHYCVGGNTKFYGASLPRLRQTDFDGVDHAEGVSPPWPFTYQDLEPYYAAAERLYRVHGSQDADPTDPPRSGPYPYPPLPHDPVVAELAGRLFRQGLRPFPMPMGIDVRAGGRCIRCATCDGFPCAVDAKSDAEVCALRPALASGQVRLMPRTKVIRLETTRDGTRVTAAIAVHNGRTIILRAGTFVVSCGAVNSAVLLLRSASASHPDGLANRSGLVGRNYMVHNSTRILAVNPGRRNLVSFQKTLAINDFYLATRRTQYPLGTIQLTGKLRGAILGDGWPDLSRAAREWITTYSVDWQAISEDLPSPRNRVTLSRDGGVLLRWVPTNVKAHNELVAEGRRIMHWAGYPIVFTIRAGIAAVSHQCGTVVAGAHPCSSVVDGYCRSHDVQNLFIVDAGFFPSSAAMNPALTVAAQALRVAKEGAVLP